MRRAHLTWQGFAYPASSLRLYQQWRWCQALRTSGWDLCKLSPRLFCSLANNLHTAVHFGWIRAHWALRKGLWVSGQLAAAVYPRWPFPSSPLLLKQEAIKTAVLLGRGCAAWLWWARRQRRSACGSRRDRGVSGYVVVAPALLTPLVFLRSGVHVQSRTSSPTLSLLHLHLLLWPLCLPLCASSTQEGAQWTVDT